jgi:hypothetical protein
MIDDIPIIPDEVPAPGPVFVTPTPVTVPLPFVRSVIFYGDSGSGKTSQTYFMARLAHSLNPHKTVRVVTTDGGGLQPYQLPDGTLKTWVKAFNLLEYTGNKAYALNLISMGYWPRKLKDGTIHLAEDEACMKGAEDVQLLVVDGITGACQEMLREMSTKADTPGFKLSYRAEMAPGLTVGGLQQGHYGIIQNIIGRLVNQMNTLPYPYAATALMSPGRDNIGTIVMGPASAGQAFTDVLPAMVEDCVWCIRDGFGSKGFLYEVSGTKRVTKSEMEKEAHEAYTVGIKYIAKARVPPEIVQALFTHEWYKDGAFKGINTGYEMFCTTRNRLMVEAGLK